jgi:TPR repeat protein
MSFSKTIILFLSTVLASSSLHAAKTLRFRRYTPPSSFTRNLSKTNKDDKGQEKIDPRIEAWVREVRAKAEQGDPHAQCALGYAYSKGVGVPKDLGLSVNWYRKAAEQWDAEAQCAIGHACARGDGMTKDFVEAVKWYRKSAEQGFPQGQYALGYAYSKGIGVPKDLGEAVKWYRQAAEQGDADGQSALGDSYLNGEGVVRDVIESYAWYTLAAENDHEQAGKTLDIIRKDVSPAQIHRGQARAKELLKLMESGASSK